MKKFTLIILALQILNLSIYNTDFYVFNCFTSAREQVKDVNPIDSFAELIVEHVDGYEDAFPEPSNKNDKQSGELKHNISFKLYYVDSFTDVPEKNHPVAETGAITLTGFCNNYAYLFWKEINHPPA